MYKVGACTNPSIFKDPGATEMNKSEDKKNLQDLVSDFDVAMLVTYSGTAVHARPMVIAHLEEGMSAYLVTDINSVKVDEIKANPHALLTFQGASKYASVQGELTLTLDRTLIELMWKESWKVWFPGGKSDANIALLKFTGGQGEFWDNAGMQGLKYVYSAAKAYLAGNVMRTDSEQHAKVQF